MLHQQRRLQRQNEIAYQHTGLRFVIAVGGAQTLLQAAGESFQA